MEQIEPEIQVGKKVRNQEHHMKDFIQKSAGDEFICSFLWDWGCCGIFDRNILDFFTYIFRKR